MSATVDPSWRTLKLGKSQRLRDPSPGATAYAVETENGLLILVRDATRCAAAVVHGPGRRTPLELSAEDFEAVWSRAKRDAASELTTPSTGGCAQ